MSSIWATIKSWFSKKVSTAKDVTRVYRGKRTYQKVQNEVSKRDWWTRWTRKVYTFEQLDALETFFSNEHLAHVAFWENSTGRKCVSQSDKNACTSWRLERYEVIHKLLEKLVEGKEKITVSLYNKTMETMLEVPVYTPPMEQAKKAA